MAPDEAHAATMNGAAEQGADVGGESVVAAAGPSEDVGRADEPSPFATGDASADADAGASGTSAAAAVANGDAAAPTYALESNKEAVAGTLADSVPAASQEAPAPPQDATPTRSFFARLGRPAAPAPTTSAPSTWGDVYTQASKRAAQLREQAGAEVERLRAQREQQAKEANKQQEEFVIPPSAGTLVDGAAVAPGEIAEEASEEKSEAKSESEEGAQDVEQSGTPKKSPIAQRLSPLKDAIKLVHQTSAVAAQQLIFPVDALAGSEGDLSSSSGGSRDSDDSRIDSRGSVDSDGASAASAEGKEEDGAKGGGKEGIFKKGGSDGGTAATAVGTPTRFGAFTGIGQRFRTLRETGSFDSSHHTGSPRKGETPVVGGADRVGGLRHFQLEGIVDAGPLPPPLPPSVPGPGLGSGQPPGRDDLAKHTGGEWTMASNRGPHAVATSAPPLPPPYTMSRTLSASSAVSSASVTSEDGQLGTTARAAPTKRTSYYEEVVRSVLRPGQRALFFGKGTMGVVLKPTYLASWRGRDGGGLLSSSAAARGGKRGGVFIDSMIPGGHADKSGVVFVGDHVVKIGAVDVENMTLEEVVAVIQRTRRPNIMVLTSEHDIPSVDVADGGADETKDARFGSALDLAFGLANKLSAEGMGDLASPEGSPGKALKPTVSANSLLDGDDEEDEASTKDEEVLFGSPAAKTSVDPADDAGDSGESDTPAAEPEGTPAQSPPAALPPYTVEDLLEYASHRTNGPGSDGETQRQRAATLKRAALFSPHFRSALHLSLAECVVDPRRYSFLEHFFRNWKDTEGDGGDQEAEEDDNDATSAPNQRRMLALYLELCTFRNALSACSASDRETLLDYARTISQRFLPEDGAPDQSGAGRLPEHVAHLALGGTEKVQGVRFALRDEDEFFSGDGGSHGFDDVRSSLGAFLSTQESYLSFLLSDDCARMRAYLRGTCPRLPLAPEAFLKPDAGAGFHHNLLLHAILHLVCMKEEREEGGKDNFIKNDALAVNFGKRNMGAASLIGCAIFIARSLKLSMEAAVEGLIEDGMAGSTSANLQIYQTLVNDVEFLWEAFIAPAAGALASLDLSDDVQAALDATRRLLVSSVDNDTTEEKSPNERTVAVARRLSSVEVSSSVQSLAEALLREYTLTVYPNFCRHIFYEWACKEAQDRLGCPTATDEYLATSEFNGLAKGWMNRFLRQMEFPPGISLHRPSALSPPEAGGFASSPNGDAALVFGAEGVPDGDEMRRFSCVSLQPETDGSTKSLTPEDIPPIFESYAVVPPFSERPFQGMLQDTKNGRVSADGWEVSLTNFVIPSQGNGAADEDNWMYCVSLVLRKSSSARPKVSEREINNECVSELQCDGSTSEITGTGFESPLSVNTSEYAQSRTMKVSQELTEFNKQLLGPKWSQQNVGATIGLALISSRSVTVAMRETLALLFNDLCSVKSPTGDTVHHICQPLVDLLGVLSHSEVETASLGCLLEPYVAHATSRWIDRPLSDQSSIFSEAAGMQLLQALPPVPLALAFVTLLLEQKVVFSSSRRGVLMSTSFAMMQLLKPLKWAHLHVPLVPFSMMNELIHYPAPFMLGIPTDERESAAILSTLPSDVTLVDLDVGRVILSSVFASNDSKSTDGEDGEAVTAALRSQVLFLAESLGGAFGAAMYPNSWCADSPFATFDETSTSAAPNADSFSGVRSICEEFVSELVSGIHSCCLWIEEDHSGEAGRSDPAIIFDEDRFFHIKNMRAEGRYVPLIQKAGAMDSKGPLSLDHFDLIFEAFLRTQSLSIYISDGDKKQMSFW
ncbi:hypothetical protein ACHAXT_007747 [Thalassiosira profunda]